MTLNNENKAGILLHITSLSGIEGIGTLGKEAHAFIDYLSAAGQRIWQILPINPTSIFSDNCPFQGYSLFAGEPLLINLELLVEKGDLKEEERMGFIERQGMQNMGQVDFPFLWKAKLGFGYSDFGVSPLWKAYLGFTKKNNRARAFYEFCERNNQWLDDYAYFMALKQIYGFEKPWHEWDEEDKSRKPGFNKKLVDKAEYCKYLQFVFDEQISSLLIKARRNGIELIGDIPIYPSYDSADVWANPDLFQLNEDGSMRWVAAVPPDYFSEDGQIWGSPVYNWDSNNTFKWWAARIEGLLEYHDALKFDHFRGIMEYGRIPPNEKTARNAKWVKGPGKQFFEYVRGKLGALPIIAEDLGIITPEIRQNLQELGFPGMNIFIFADLQDKGNMYLPENAKANSASYTGTHDNETLLQKMDGMDPSGRKSFVDYLNKSSEEGLNWKAIDLLYKSASNRVIIPMQDILGLGGEARMNNPSRTSGNWIWRMTEKQMDEFRKSIPHLRELAIKHNRYV